jgi:3-hydroxybutyryl-CoA dehydratase
MQPIENKFENINVGDKKSFSKIWNMEDVKTFSNLSGDLNPLHIDEDYAKKTQFGKIIVHGMLVASSFSTFVGMYLPGKYCLYIKQDILFKKPVFVGDSLLISGEVVQKIESTKMLEISLKIFRNTEIVIEGSALVKVLN